MSARRAAHPRRKGGNRNITITPKGYAILAAMDRGEYRTISTAEARTMQLAKINARSA